MRRFGRFLGRVLLVLVLLVAAICVFGPVESVERSGPFSGDLSDPAAYLAAREAAFGDITPGAEARIVWAGAEGASTPLSLLYLHGFSATSEEIRPVPDLVAEALGANLVFARLPGHGRDGEALARASAGAWVDATAEMLAVARAVGDRVLVVGTSTGATLAAIAVTEPDMAEDIAGVIMVSPNFGLANPAARILTWPGASIWGPWIAGAERSFETQNEGHATYWTWRYPTVATISLGALMQEAAGRDYTAVDLPLLMIYSPQDKVVSITAAEAFAEGWGGPVMLTPQNLPDDGADPYAHVIAGEILSPAMTEIVTEQMIDWADTAVSGVAR